MSGGILMAYLEVYREESTRMHRWRWRRKADNHQVTEGPQQSFTRRSSAVRSARKAHPEDGDPRILS